MPILRLLAALPELSLESSAASSVIIAVSSCPLKRWCAKQVREGEAPSYFNAVEATVLVDLVEGLLATTQRAGGRGVKPDDLGVMATYRKQVGVA